MKMTNVGGTCTFPYVTVFNMETSFDLEAEGNLVKWPTESGQKSLNKMLHVHVMLWFYQKTFDPCIMQPDLTNFI